MKPATGQGSAKKRWLRQAMYDCHGCEIQSRSDSCSIDAATILDNGCLSPNSHGDLDSLNGVGEDVLTPLKKRRLMRESIESLPSPQSPSTATSLDDTDNTTVSNSLISDNSTEHGVEINENEISLLEKVQPSAVSTSDIENSNHSTSDALIDERKPDDNLTVEKESTICGESFFTPISTLKLTPDEDNEDLPEKPCANNLLTLSNENDKSDIVLESTKLCDVSENSNSENRHSLLDTSQKETPSADANLKENTSSTIEMDVEEDVPHQKDLFDEEQLKNVNSEETISVNIETPVDNNCTLPVNNHTSSSETILNSCETKNESSTSSDDLKTKLNSETETIFPYENVENCKNNFSISDADSVKVDLSETVQSPKVPENSETDNSELLLNPTVCSSVSSCNSVDKDSNASVQLSEFSEKISDCEFSEKIDTPEIPEKQSCENTIDEQFSKEEIELQNELLDKTDSKILEAENKSVSESRCISSDEFSCNSLLQSKETACASATQKRKVSLSEYRMRMREGTAKVRPAAEITNKNSSTTSICAISLPDTLPEQVTLAPLPLFEKARAQKHFSKQPTQQIANKRKKESSEEPDVTEHRENLNERLKREFGFDVEGTTNNISLKSKVSIISNSEAIKLLGARPSPPPPPPPPPRLARPQQPESMTMAIPPTQFSFPPSHFPRPQFMVPRQVPGAPYIRTQPPMLPAVHPINTNPSQCSLRSPLLPSTHPFTPSMTLLRPPPQHDFTPVNAQRFVQQPPPPPPHKSYLHIYPSGLYK